MIEEWFIDKHLYHFSARTLMRLVVAAGFEIIAAPDIEDHTNLLIVARKAYTAIAQKISTIAKWPKPRAWLPTTGLRARAILQR
jgi:hypothetical protein